MRGGHLNDFLIAARDEGPIAEIDTKRRCVLFEHRRTITRRVHGDRDEMNVPLKRGGQGALDVDQGSNLHGAARRTVREDEVHHHRAAF